VKIWRVTNVGVFPAYFSRQLLGPTMHVILAAMLVEELQVRVGVFVGWRVLSVFPRKFSEAEKLRLCFNVRSRDLVFSSGTR
jgi:hypothetical protein